MTSKISMLQRQMAYQAAAINTEHKLITVCKDQIKWLKGVPDIASTKTRIDGLYKCVEASKRRIAKLVEMQVFTREQLHEAYVIETMFEASCENNTFCRDAELPSVCVNRAAYMTLGESRFPRDPNSGGPRWSPDMIISEDYKHNPKFMDQAPAAEVGSVVGDEL